MITNSWQNTHLFCIYRHETPVEMVLQSGQTVFYACPKYDLEQLGENERRCNNRLSIADFDKALEHIHQKLQEAEENDEFYNLTNYRWKTNKNIEFVVLKHEGDSIDLGVINWKAIRS